MRFPAAPIVIVLVLIVPELVLGDIELPTTSPGAEFFLLDDSDPSTLTYVDAANPLTIVNIGRNAPLFDVGLGLDFSSPTEINMIRVLPLEDPSDPGLATPGEIAALAGFFVWTVFTSDDQVNWVERTVNSVSYSVFGNRFEISFPGGDTEFIKVVTTPIPTAPGEIRIAAIQGFTTAPPSGVPSGSTWSLLLLGALLVAAPRLAPARLWS